MLADFPKTSAWVDALNDSLIAEKARRNCGTYPDEAYLKIGVLAGNREVVDLIPEALKYRDERFRAPGGKRIDIYLPSRMLFELQSYAPVADQGRQGFERYFKSLPEDRAKDPEREKGRAMFQQNWGLLVLGALDGRIKFPGDPDYAPGGPLSTLFADLATKNLMPSKLPQEVHGRFEYLLQSMRRYLDRRPEAIAQEYRFLFLAQTDAAKMKMVGSYFSTMPYRNHLLLEMKPGGALAPNLFGRAFRELVERAYQERVVEQPAPVPFRQEDQDKVRRLMALVSLGEDPKLGRIVPLLTWMAKEGGRMAKQANLASAAKSEAVALSGRTDGDDGGQGRVPAAFDDPGAIQAGKPELYMPWVASGLEGTLARGGRTECPRDLFN